MVQSRTWANINKPGGCAKITKVHTTDDGNYIEGLDVKYVLGGGREKNLDPVIVSPYETLERGGRKRRSREFLMQREEDLKAEQKTALANKKVSKIAAATEAAGKENHASLKSSPTCSTPEKPKAAKKPKKVTPIPRMVITGKKIDYVSPMPEDISSLGGFRTQSQKIVARGLVFDASGTKKKSKSKSKGSDQPRPDSIHQSETQRSTKCQHNTSTVMDKKPPPASVTISQKKSSSTMKNTTNTKSHLAGKRKLGADKIGKNQIAVPSRGGCTSLASASRSRYKAPSNSFSRVTSAYDKKESTASEPNRKLLLDVFRLEKEKARSFMDEMVGHRNDDELGELGASNPKEKKGFFTTNARYDEFLSHLNKVWFKVDEEEVSEEKFREVLNEVSSNSFTAEELNSHIQTWCDEGKEVMKSDGMLYRIR